MAVSDTPLGFKKITLENWLMPDMNSFPGITPDLWIEEVSRPELAPGVPQDIVALFECARAMYVYGLLFYPLSTMAGQQCHRVAEAAAAAKCKQLGMPETKPAKAGKIPRAFTFADNIDRLLAAGVIPATHARQWTATRRLRNMSSHPSFQEIITPGMALAVLQNTAEQINVLYVARSKATNPKG
jgi:hypothetical protein